MKENLWAKDSIRTVSGIYVNIVDPKPEMFEIEDIIHALGHVPRFTGHTRYHYSVLHHSLQCAEMIIDQTGFVYGINKLVRTALLHDASEAYLSDIASPIKQHLPDYYIIEDRLMKVISEKFDFYWPIPDEVKRVDLVRLEEEWQAYMIAEVKPLPLDEVKDWFRSIFNDYSEG